ncbi:MAG: phosphodiester glycosidase family protein [Candidatus Kapaibacterium sp.]
MPTVSSILRILLSAYLAALFFFGQPAPLGAKQPKARPATTTSKKTKARASSGSASRSLPTKQKSSSVQKKPSGQHARHPQKSTTRHPSEAPSKAFVSKKKAGHSATKRTVVVRNTGFQEIFTDTLYSAGLRYRHFIYGKQRHSVHVAEISTTEPSLKVGLIKGLERIDGLERLGDMSIRHDSTSRDTLYAGINANFWRAYRNTPIGPMVSGGEVVHLHSYRQWSSAFFDAKNRMTIDQFILTGKVRMKNRTLVIDNVNERVDSNGLVVYNTYGGSSIPFVSPIDLEKAAQEFLQNHSMTTEDSTESGLNMQTLRDELANAKREASIEFPMKKVVLRYLRTPVINREIPCLVRAIDSGEVQMPIRGCIVSFGAMTPLEQLPRRGDTVFIKFSTNVADTVQFLTAVSGTPRLVRQGVAKHEAMIEGSHAKRFLNQNLARTAIGTDRTRTKNYFVMIEANNEKGKGATLAQTAAIMKAVGAWNAMNLDGGGSAMMIVCGANACTNSTVPSGRKISAALGVFKRQRIPKSSEKDR